MNKTEICNLALGRIGNFRITSIDETGSAEAEHCRRFFEITRQSLLRDFDWNFATEETELSAIADGEAFDYDYAYALPADYLQAINFNGTSAGTKQSLWRIAKGILYSDETESTLEYIRDVEDCTEWDSVFVQAFAWYLAAAIAPSITSSPASAADFLRAGKLFLSEAKGIDTQETALKIIRGVEHSAYQAAREGRGAIPRNWMLQDWGPPN